MPTGTGKTVCLLSLILSYIKQKNRSFKLVYCTRTIVEMEKTLDELKFVQEARERDFGSDVATQQLCEPILAMCLSSRRNLCIHKTVSKEDDREKVDSECRARTANWVKSAPTTDDQDPKQRKPARIKTTDIEDLARCQHYDKFEEHGDTFNFPKGIYNLEDLKKLGRDENMCPYFLARRFLTQANIIVYNYAYLLDPKIANLVSSELQKDCIVVFDECHNIDNACIEALSMNLNRKSLELAG